MKTRRMCLTALMSALLCLAGPLTVSIGPIPLSAATLAVCLAGALLGPGRGTLCVALYILIGAVGMPVYAGFTAGVQRLAGVTGGFLIGYLPCAWIVGLGFSAFPERSWMGPASMVAGTAVCYVLGTLWFMLQMDATLSEAMVGCVLPFLPGEAVKIIVATIAAKALRNRVKIYR